MFKKILFPLTFDIDIGQILDGSQFLKSLNPERFDLLHVCNGLSNAESSQRALQKAADIVRQKTTYKVSTEILEGHAPSKIIYNAREHNYDLIFIPAHNKSIMTRSFLGCTASDLIRMTDTPTLIYKNHSDKPNKWNTVIYATDFKEAAERARPYVKYIGHATSRLVIQHVGTRAADPSSEIKRKEFIKEKLEGIKKDLVSSWSEIITITELGNPSTEIVSAVEAFKADLVVVGRGNTTFLKRLLGSTAERVANSVKSSVLLIP